MARWLVRLLGALSGASFLRRQDARRSAQIAEEKSRDRQYRKPIVFETPLEQNAAVWYRRALERQPYAPDTQRDLLARVDAGFVRFSTPDAARLSGYCSEARDWRLQQAFRSVSCDWEAGYGLFDEKLLRPCADGAFRSGRSPDADVRP